jgi:hypothetical protein
MRMRHSVETRGRPRRRPVTPAPNHGRGLDTRTEGVLQLQSRAGNARVASVLGDRPPVVQRGLFDMLGGLLGGGVGGLRSQGAALAGQGVQAGIGALGSSLGGPFGALLGGTGAGLGGAASQLVAGNTAGALSGLQGVGAGVAGPFAETAMGMLGGGIGGQAGGFLSGLGAPVGQGLSSIISGGSPAQAGMGVLGAAAPGLKDMASSFLGGI